MKRSSNCEFENIAMTIFDLLFEVNADGIIESFNQASPALLPELKKSAVGKTLPSALPKRLADTAQKALQEVSNQSGTRNHASPMVVKEGQKWFEVYAYHTAPCQKPQTPFIVAVRDITKERHIHELLVESEAHFRSMFEKTADALLLLDPNLGMFVDCNQATLDMLNFKDKRLALPLNPAELSPALQPCGTPSLEKAQQLIATALKNGSHRFEWVHCSPFRADFPVEVLLTPLEVGEKKLMLTTWRDITERKRDIEELIKANALKSQFLNIAAHELRTPVTAFSLLLQITKRQLEKGQPVTMETLDRLIRQSARISNLVIDLLEVARLESGTLKLEKATYDVYSLVHESLDDIKLQYPEVHFNFKKSDENLTIVADHMRIHQVLVNLLDNAIKYAPSEKEIEIEVHSLTSATQFIVRDFGKGIPDEIMENIFKPFTRGNTDRVMQTSGLGLGLYICKIIVELHGGKIEVDSRTDEGTTFSFEIPTESI